MYGNNNLSCPARRPIIITLLVTAGAHGTAEATVMEELMVTATRADKLVHEVPAAVGVGEQDSIQKARQQLSLDEALTLLLRINRKPKHAFNLVAVKDVRGVPARHKKEAQP